METHIAIVFAVSCSIGGRFSIYLYIYIYMVYMALWSMEGAGDIE